MLVSVKQLKKETNHSPLDSLAAEKPFAAVNSEEQFMVDAAAEVTAIAEGVNTTDLVDREENLAQRKLMIAAKTVEPVDFAYERAIGKNDSLYSNFIELIALTKRKVGRIVVIKNRRKIGYATGFMVSENLLLTNYHVFNDASMAKESEVHFFYEYDASGHPLTPVIFKFDTTHFFSDAPLDYCFVGVQPMDVSEKYPLSNIGYLYLDKTIGKVGDVGVEKLNIIHHPLGDFKQLSIRENTFVGIDDSKIYYETDTAQGSSGSAVFNDQWQVVGLHHKSVAKMSADGQDYVDADGDVIKAIDGKIDITRVVWLKNEGMRISVILKHLEQHYPNRPILESLAVPPKREVLTIAVGPSTAPDVNVPRPIPDVANPNEIDMTLPEKNITIHVPVSALSAENTIDISLSTRNTSSTLKNSAPEKSVHDAMLDEIAKIDKENSVDFSGCNGYVENFLGSSIPMPEPTAPLHKELAYLKDGSHILKYHKYSVIFSAVRRMPLLSAVNAEGDATQRLDNSKRSDDWLRDRRIDVNCQLTDAYYSHSGFDKGHMSRFEDANWDSTEALAYRNGIYTCFYTNACPQVPEINRKGENAWGRLERTILEKGIKAEKGNKARMSVFNGPIFTADAKPFKGVLIPSEFFKIILWVDDQGNLKATGFRLSQQHLDGKINYDLEALDIHKNVAFKKYQSSIKKIAALTQIDFSTLAPYDTYVATDGGDELLLEDDASLML